MFNFIFTAIAWLGIDLGAANTLVYVKGKKFSFANRPWLPATKNQNKWLLSAGKQKMLGKTPDTIEAIRPLKMVYLGF